MNKAETQSDTMLRRLSMLSDPTRVRLLRLLEREELTVSDLCAVLQLPQSTVSRHLKLLADESWLVSRRSGTTHLYRVLLDELMPAQRDLWVLTRKHISDWATLGQDDVRLDGRLSERHHDAKAFFDDAAENWDRLRSELYGHTFGHEALLTLLPDDWTVADFGCGTGRLTIELAPNVGRVIGIDNNPAMLAIAREELAGVNNAELVDADLADVPLEDGCADAAVGILVLTYAEDVRPILAEMRRVLRPGGRVVLVDLMQHDRDDFRRSLGQSSLGFAPDTLQSLMTEAGFGDVDTRPLSPTPEANGPALLVGSGCRGD